MIQLPIIERAIGYADRIAVITAAGTSTYSDLAAKSEAVASALLGNVDDLQEARIAYLVPAGARYVSAQWGIWRAGGVAVPLSISATEKELEYTLTDSQSQKVIVAREFAEKVAPICDRHSILVIVIDDLPMTNAADLPLVALHRRAMILYTSGTTSKPKGVVTTHACVQAQIELLVEAWQWQQSDQIPLFLPLHHIHGIINILSCALWSGAKVEAFPRFDIETVLSRVSDGAYTLFMAVPTIYVMLIRQIEKLPATERESIVQGYAQMRLMVSGSAALPASVHRKWTELTGQELLERYGMTELGMALSNPYAGERRPGAVGQPLPGVEIRLQDNQGNLIVAEDIAGEIQVRGPSVFAEYWNRPDATRDAFVEGWFRTGDIAIIEHGYYRIMGRSSVDIIKSGGYKLSALEIEASLLDHPAIAQCAVVGLPDDKWGETVAAAAVLESRASLDLDSLQAWCQDRISPYKIPRQLLLVDEFPRNAMGKVQKPAVSLMFTSSSTSDP